MFLVRAESVRKRIEVAIVLVIISLALSLTCSFLLQWLLKFSPWFIHKVWRANQLLFSISPNQNPSNWASHYNCNLC